MDKISKKQRSYTMSRIRSTNTKLEVKFKELIRKKGIIGRYNVTNLPGKPDFALKKKKIVIFLDSCFWHKCPKHFRMPKSNLGYWRKKIERNVRRDHDINKYYCKKGWTLLRFWEHEINKNGNKAADKVLQILRK